MAEEAEPLRTVHRCGTKRIVLYDGVLSEGVNSFCSQYEGIARIGGSFGHPFPPGIKGIGDTAFSSGIKPCQVRKHAKRAYNILITA